MYRQLAEACHDIFGEENGAVLLLVSSRGIVNWIDNMDIGWMHDCAVREPKDVYELVSKYDCVYCRQRRCCRPRRGWWDYRGGISISEGDSRSRATMYSLWARQMFPLICAKAK